MKLVNVLMALLVSAALFFGLFEGGLRLLGFGPPEVNTEFDATLGWRGIPNSTIENSTPEFDVEIELDDLGLRDDFRGEEALEVALHPERTRVLFLGDSFVGGYTVRREHLFVDVLEEAWRNEGREIEIVNAGLQGYSTDQQLLWLREHGAKFDPDLVVLFPYENDIWWNGRGDYVGEPKPRFDADGELDPGPLAEPAPRSWFGRTATGSLGRLFRGIPKVDVGGAKVNAEFTPRIVEPPAETAAAEAVTRRLIAALAEDARGLGAAFAVAPIPSKEHVQRVSEGASTVMGKMDAARPHALFVSAAKDAGAEHIDLLGALAEAEAGRQERGRSVYYDRDFHLNAHGNQVVARTLYDALDRLSLVPFLVNAEATQRPGSDPARKGASFPKWPFWFLGLLGALGTLYATTYEDEPARSAYLKVGGLLAVIFAIALGGSALLASLPPVGARIALAAVLIGLFTFIAYKLGDRIGTIGELLRSFTLRGHWYLLPLLMVLLTVGSLLVVAASSPLVAPFIYTLF